MPHTDWKAGLPDNIAQELECVVADTCEALGDAVRSIALFGSAAEGRLRATSDVNLVIVLDRLEIAKAKLWRPKLQVSAAAIDLQPMIILESELSEAAEAFAVKFADIAHRHRILYGTDPFSSLSISRETKVRRLRQVLLNLTIRLRQSLLLFNEGGQTHAITDAIGPLRVAAMILLELEGGPVPTPREALDTIGKQLGGKWPTLIERIRVLREQGTAVDERPTETLGAIIELADKLSARCKPL